MRCGHTVDSGTISGGGDTTLIGPYLSGGGSFTWDVVSVFVDVEFE